MIQDSFDPIYYASVQKIKNTSTGEACQMTFKYKEHLEIPVQNLKINYWIFFYKSIFGFFFDNRKDLRIATMIPLNKKISNQIHHSKMQWTFTSPKKTK